MAALRYMPFPNTHWSLVHRAGLSDAATRRQALSTLLDRYAPALHSYLRLIRHMDDDAADDLLQSFIADQILEKEMLRHAAESRGRFRSFLLVSLHNFSATRYRARQRHPTEPLSDEALVASREDSPDHAVEAAWARALVHGVLAAMREQCACTGRQDIWAVFEARALAEFFSQDPPTPYEALATRLHLASPTQAANLLVTAKRMYARLLRTAVAEYERDDNAIDAEIADLRRILARQSAADAP